ncbi:hypothetical protein [Thiomicrorhabdus sediminis]
MLRFWTHELKGSFDSVLLRIENAMQYSIQSRS